LGTEETTVTAADESEVDQQDLEGGEIGEKGLQGGAIGFVSNVVIGVASVAPGYSIATTLGFIVAIVGLQSPAVIWVSFVPMLLIATAYYYMNRDDPDCGTSFSWVSISMGPHLGWFTGWVVVAAEVIVMASLAQIAGLYTFLLLGWQSAANSSIAVMVVGVIWIVLMTWICYRGIELSAQAQFLLLGAELVTLLIFAAVALFEVYTGTTGIGGVTPQLSWLNPFAIDSVNSLVGGVMLALFIYWGWDATVTANEESENSDQGPGVAALASTVILVFTYVIVGIAAIAFAGTDFLVNHQSDVLSALGTHVLGTPWNKLLIITVLTSSAASTQTTIIASSRTVFSMAHREAIPDLFGRVHQSYLSPDAATIATGGGAAVWYLVLTFISQNVLAAAISALGLMIAFYYGLTGFACVVYYRHELMKSAKNFLLMGVAPAAGGVILFGALGIQLVNFANPGPSTETIFGIGLPLAIGIGVLVVGIILMVWARYTMPTFFENEHPQTFTPESSDSSAGSGQGTGSD
jgi:amino acid transporter